MKKRILACILIMIMTLSLAACGSSDKNTENDLTKITFVLDWTPNTNHTGLYVAQANGFFEEAEFAVSFQDSMMPAIVGENALPIEAVAAVIQHNTSGIISRAGEGMDRPAGMEGKKYATWDLDLEKATIKQVVEKDGGDFDKIEMIPSTVTDEVSALKSKSVDAIWIFYGWAGVAAEVAGLETDYFDFADIDPVFDF